MATPKKSQSSTKTKTSTTSKTTAAKSSKTPEKTVTTTSNIAKSSVKKSSNASRIVAWVIGIVALLAVVAAIVVYLCFGNGSMSIKTTSGTKVETEYIDFKDGALRVKVPTQLSALSDDKLTEIYGNSNKPTAVYTNDKQDIGVVINITDTALNNDQIRNYLDTMTALLDVTGNIVSTDYYTAQGHNIGTLELSLESTDKDETGRYDHMAFFSLDDKLVIVTFETSSDLRDEWKPVGQFIIKSISFTK